jgi:hypothetical protein
MREINPMTNFREAEFRIYKQLVWDFDAFIAVKEQR